MTDGPPNWPRDVTPISVDDLNRLRLNGQDQLFWDGRRIEIRRKLDLTRAQKVVEVLVAVAAVLGGLGGFFSGVADASDFLCARHIGWLSCPVGR